MHDDIYRFWVLLLLLPLWQCNSAPEPETKQSRPKPSLLLITLDTTRADHLGFLGGEPTPNLDRLAAGAQVFEAAYATAPVTLPSHTSMLTGLYVAGHGVHENGRYLDPQLPLIAPRLASAGYQTAAFVSAFPLSGNFGLKRGFHHYDDPAKGEVERSAGTTTDAALQWLSTQDETPVFLWVHYFDPHHPYDPPEPYATTHADNPYQGEIAYMDQQLGRLLTAFQTRADHRIIVAGDHGEGLGEHGEAYHGHLIYDSTMRVPLIVAGTNISQGRVDQPVSLRRIYHTLAGFAGLDTEVGLLAQPKDLVLGEAMKPYIHYGWQPQIMAIEGTWKTIKTKEYHIYDLQKDPEETQNLAPGIRPARESLAALQTYPLPDPSKQSDLDEEARAQLQSLGYAASSGMTQVSGDRPEPHKMTHVFPLLDKGSDQFVAQDYDGAVRTYVRVMQEDPKNLMVHLRLAVAHGFLNNDELALEHFRIARKLAPEATDVHHYLAMHHYRMNRFSEAAPHFQAVLKVLPNKLPALKHLAQIQTNQGQTDSAKDLFERALTLDPTWARGHLQLAEIHMGNRDSSGALKAFQEAWNILGEPFPHHLEIGVCLMDLSRFEEAAESLERVEINSGAYPMARFKRAQVAAILNDPELPSYIQEAQAVADPVTRPLIANEQLFRR